MKSPIRRIPNLSNSFNQNSGNSQSPSEENSSNESAQDEESENEPKSEGTNFWNFLIPLTCLKNRPDAKYRLYRLRNRLPLNQLNGGPLFLLDE